MAKAKRIAELEAELNRQRERVASEVARLRGLEAELDALRAGLAGDEDLAVMERTEAVLHVLRGAKGTLRPKEVHEALQQAGRSDAYRDVTATLAYLRERGLVRRAGRGLYVAT